MSLPHTIRSTDWVYRHFEREGEQWLRLVNIRSNESMEVRVKDLTWILKRYILRLNRKYLSADS